MTLDWPTGFERTAPAERERNRSFEATLAQTTSDLQTEMDRLDPDDWRASIGNQHTKSNGLPLHNANPDDPGFVLRWTDDGEDFAVACDASPRLRDNVRTVYLWVHETRMRGNRPVVTGDTQFAAARLPPGDESTADGRVVAHSRPPHEVLEVAPDAPDAVVKAAYHSLAKERHPDSGGSEDAMAELNAAKEAMLDE
ncbi:J domain-containing protein [Halarchaeum sp. P4]|uniref:J domain-containing protein n=1 Tax=Halarchaeum sp. P4 TaxID=3421639 RepID=UPI003EBA2145